MMEESIENRKNRSGSALLLAVAITYLDVDEKEHLVSHDSLR
jgi:hypothetical protein